MKMALDDGSGVNLVRAYEDGRVSIREQTYTQSLIALPDRLFTGWEAESVQQLRAAHFQPLLELAPEVLILGTGGTQVFPDPAVFMTLIDLGIGFEVMDNGAACRTYNILLGEGRRAALALILASR
jgi:uncharacterized protein